MIELLVALAVAGSIAGIVTVILTSGMTASQRFNENAVAKAQTSKILEGFSKNMTIADSIESISPSSLTFLVNRNNICERHQYKVLSTVSGLSDPSFSIQHIVQEVPLSDNTKCSSLNPTIWDSGEYSTPTIDRTEVSNLTSNPDAGPIFSYYTRTGEEINVSQTGSSSSDIALFCSLGSIKIEMTPRSKREENLQTVQTRVTPQITMMGLLCNR